ncbi:MAG: hypothetical protein RLZZ127_71 [Planctomycetota bacterium]|jgi:hypothetical protein
MEAMQRAQRKAMTMPRITAALAALAFATGTGWSADVDIAPASVAVTEGGATAVVTVGLGAYAPVHPVTVVLQVSEGAPRGISLSATTVVFPAGATAATVAVTVTAFDDAVAEGLRNHAIVAQAFTLDPGVTATTDTTTVTVNDNDPGILVTTSGGSNIVVEEGDAASVGSFVLNHTTGAFTASITSPATGDADYPRDVEFSTAIGGPWSAALSVGVSSTTPLTVFVRASRSTNLNQQDDPIAEGTELIPVTVSMSVGGGSDVVVPVTVTDNDSAGILILETADSPYTVAEGALGLTGVEEGLPGTADSYTIRLSSKPSTTVAVAITADAQISVAPTSLIFTPANWDQPQTVLVNPIDDGIVEASPHLGAITHVAESLDPRYDGIAGAVLSPSIRDDELAGTPGVIVTVAAGGVRTAEGGATDTYRMRLASQPVSDVVVTVAPDSQVSTVPAALTFTTANWFIDQVVTVTAVDDAAIEGAHLGQITHGSASQDPAYAGISIGGVTVQIADNDGSSGTGLVISHTGAGMSVAEDDGAAVSPIVPPATAWDYGTSDTFTVRLPAPPSANVQITVAETTTGPTGIEVLPSVLLFTPANWNVPQLVTVRAINDDTVTAGRTANIRLTPSAVFATEDVPVSVLDDDAYTFALTTSGTLDESLPNTSGSLGVALTSIPTAPTTITVYTDGQTVVDTDPVTPGLQNTLTFTNATWSVPQNVQVFPVDDAIDEADPHTGIVTVVADVNYGSATDSVTFSIDDNDTTVPPGTPGITVSPTLLSIAEDGASTTYTVQLNTQPAATVRVTVDPGSQALVNGVGGPIELVFAPGAWNTPQVVTVTAVDDAVDEDGANELQPHSGSITHFMTSADPAYSGAGQTVTLSITDNDTADVVVVATGTDTTVIEGGAGDAYAVYLASRPTGTVQVDVSAPAPLLVQGPGMASPSSQATLFFSESGGGDGSSVNAPALWSQAVLVQVTASDDAVPNGTRLVMASHATSSVSDALYQGLSDQIQVRIIDDEAGVVLVPASVAVTEGSSITAAIVLSREPTATVIVSIPSTVDVGITGADADLATAALDIVFTSADWDQPRGVIISAIDDAIVEGTLPESLVATAVSADAAYNGSTSAVSVTVSDNGESAAVVLSDANGQSPSVLRVQEGGTSATFSVRITSDPGVPATVAIAPSSGQVRLNGGLPGATLTLTFTSTNWTAAQIVTVSAVNDAVIEGAHTTNLTISSGGGAGGAYGALGSPVIQVQIDDNEQAIEIDWAASQVRQLGEGATQSTFLVRLTAPPATQALVTITPSSTQAFASPSMILFTAANYGTAVTVTIRATDDAVQDGSVPATFAFSANVPVLGVKEYALATVGSSTRSVLTLDNDQAGIVITPSALAVSEGGAPGVLTIRLASQPLGNLILTAGNAAGQVRFLGLSDPISASSATKAVVFTPATWDLPQFIRVVAVDDALIEGLVSATVSFQQSGPATVIGAADDGYPIAGPVRIPVQITDNDVPTVAISAVPAFIYEHQPNLAVWTITRSPGANLVNGFAADPLDVPLTLVTPGSWPADFTVQAVGGAATSAVDLVTRTFTATIPSGATSARIRLRPVNDATGGEADMTVTLRIRSAPGLFTLSLPSTASIVVRDDEPVAATSPRIITFPGISVRGTLAGSATAIPGRTIVSYRLRPDQGTLDPAVATLTSFSSNGTFAVTAEAGAVPGMSTSFAWEAVDSFGATSSVARTLVRIASYDDTGRPRIVSDPTDEIVPVSGALSYQVRAIGGSSALRYLLASGQPAVVQGAVINPVSGLLTWAVPPALAPGHYRIAILAIDDATGTADMQTVTVRVVAATASN